MTASASSVAAIRRFNRFYTQRIGVLQEGLNRSPFSLTSARVLYEIAQRSQTTASEIGSALALDAGYLSRILSTFTRDGLIHRTTSGDDARKTVLELTAKGQRAFARLNEHTQTDIMSMIGSLHRDDQRRLVAAMTTIESVLGGTADAPAKVTLRAPRSGDYGWVIQRHGELYAQEYHWNEEFEGLVAGIVANFIKHFDAKREQSWIAEVDGENAGCVFLVKKSETVAQLRMLLVEPSARGRGIGRRLVEECIEFARRAGYKRIILWTNDVLHAARHIYQSHGFRLTEEEKHHSFGADLIGQTWELKL